MSLIDVVELSSDDELGEVDVKPVKLELGAQTVKNKLWKTQRAIQDSEENSSSVLDQGQSPLHDTGISCISLAPLCRQFWKAGNYNDGIASKPTFQNGNNYLHVHPMFLHSNATSHKWAFGAIAELLDNAVDEIQNGATFVNVDKISNPKDGSPALLIQDDGNGMDPEAMRRCMSFGFSDKKSKSAIGQYGNGFKTSTMRLGADVIVFSRHQDKRTLTQSIGLLSYTFLVRTGHDRIVVPMVDYKFNPTTETLDIMHGREHFMSNLSLLLQWSPYSTEAELLKQFNDIGAHGTKVMIYNLWFNNDGSPELDFNTDPEDIRISGDTKKVNARLGWKEVNERHIANRLHHSLRVYLSILYLRIPATFQIILRGRVVEHHNTVDDLKFPEYILYRPQTGGTVEGQVITTIGFLNDAPHVSYHGFNVYHKNRLILPYWQVVSYLDSRGRGVVGVLEADFIEPSHNKQDFERTSLFQKLEVRLKEMTWEYWDYHCGLIGYQVKKKLKPVTPQNGIHQSFTLGQAFPALGSKNTVLDKSGPSIPSGLRKSVPGTVKRKEHDDVLPVEYVKGAKVINTGKSQSVRVNPTGNPLKDQEAKNLMQENNKLRAKCMEYEKREEELSLKVAQLKRDMKEVDDEYNIMLAELEALRGVKKEKGA
ncbi:PREDICTED: MORC family CW-type zinc finger protein 3 isoform X2 [Fragaria vesca subsp. vesca]|uniref:MORC family CW-type zinc finger protein 3 isoform X2 n=1 Tax=Fragaria vesca subsp. vesca TaxID=101020 RepID=UPI0002C32FDF|nr:PREDICTED: MORC family CW-type zinc finger protein 3 isoform X2 [Fragaria vesca subsp. vesca]